MNTAVATGLWLCNIILLLHKLIAGKLFNCSGYPIDIILKRTDDADAGEVTKRFYCLVKRNFPIFTMELFHNTFRSFNTACGIFNNISVISTVKCSFHIFNLRHQPINEFLTLLFYVMLLHSFFHRSDFFF